MSKLFNLSGKRFPLWRVALVVFGASFSLIVFNYLMKYISGERFNWEAYREYFPNHLLGTIATTVFSYFALNYFHSLFSRRKKFRHFILPLFVCILAVEVYNLLVDRLMPLEQNRDNPLPTDKQVVGNLVAAILYLIFILVLAVIQHLKDVRRANQTLEEQKLKLEVEKTQADLKFLKSQINPHFLHNTLNSFYARSLPLSEDLADGILTLSGMMRYALGESFTEDGKVLLRDEIGHLRNLIKLNQFRFRNHLDVQLTVEGETAGAVIIPFVLITLVENIFKHGDLTDHHQPCIIHIAIRDVGLRYFSKNKKKTGPKELSTGIGLDNIRKRLQLTYGDEHLLHIKEDKEWYSTELIIPKL